MGRLLCHNFKLLQVDVGLGHTVDESNQLMDPLLQLGAKNQPIEVMTKVNERNKNVHKKPPQLEMASPRVGNLMRALSALRSLLSEAKKETHPYLHSILGLLRLQNL
ncbi:hypothetical protein Nepgr_021140 [Nepenthes gracilis]|uniref:Uncharacterized protein n=1 Tax=Nepenthes gracilis TaxID=150966 RepID=A0AAD3SY65_NEPGR|nr:hypothetical protein Nepgr_021140 [Nepenthes gracilis]